MLSRLIVLFLVVISFSACSTLNLGGSDGPEGLKLSDVRPPLSDTKKVAIDIPKQRFTRAIREGGDLNKVRLVEIFHRAGAGSNIPEFRFMGIKSDSVYAMLGIRNLDVLVGANDFVVPGQQVFWRYLQVMPDVPQPNIEIRRDGVPIVFEYSFVE